MTDEEESNAAFTLLASAFTIVAEGRVDHHAPCVPWCDVCYPECPDCHLNHPAGHHEVASSQWDHSRSTEFGGPTTLHFPGDR